MPKHVSLFYISKIPYEMEHDMYLYSILSQKAILHIGLQIKFHIIKLWIPNTVTMAVNVLLAVQTLKISVIIIMYLYYSTHPFFHLRNEVESGNEWGDRNTHFVSKR